MFFFLHQKNFPYLFHKRQNDHTKPCELPHTFIIQQKWFIAFHSKVRVVQDIDSAV